MNGMKPRSYCPGEHLQVVLAQPPWAAPHARGGVGGNRAAPTGAHPSNAGDRAKQQPTNRKGILCFLFSSCLTSWQ